MQDMQVWSFKRNLQSTGHAQGHLWLMKAYHPKQANKGRMGWAIEPCTRAKPQHQLYECQYSMMGYEDDFFLF